MPALIVLIPATQAERTIAATIASIRAAAVTREVRIIVGAYGCTDMTEHVAAEAGAEVKTYHTRDKGKVLTELAALPGADDWVAFVAPGALWPDTLLADLAGALGDERLLGVAPLCLSSGESILSRMSEIFGARRRAWENGAGGPLDVHEGTIFLRAGAFRAALRVLAERGLDPGVDIAFSLAAAARAAAPAQTLLYFLPKGSARAVRIARPAEDEDSFSRRLAGCEARLVRLLRLTPSLLRRAPSAGLLAVGGFAGTFRAYALLLLLFLATSLFFPARDLALVAAGAAAITLALALRAAGKGGWVAGAAASLCAPVLLARVGVRYARSLVRP